MELIKASLMAAITGGSGGGGGNIMPTTKVITSNNTVYHASQDGYDGYSSVKAEIPTGNMFTDIIQSPIIGGGVFYTKPCNADGTGVVSDREAIPNWNYKIHRVYTGVNYDWVGHSRARGSGTGNTNQTIAIDSQAAPSMNTYYYDYPWIKREVLIHPFFVVVYQGNSPLWAIRSDTFGYGGTSGADSKEHSWLWNGNDNNGYNKEVKYTSIEYKFKGFNRIDMGDFITPTISGTQTIYTTFTLKGDVNYEQTTRYYSGTYPDYEEVVNTTQGTYTVQETVNLTGGTSMKVCNPDISINDYMAQFYSDIFTTWHKYRYPDTTTYTIN
jgi:hypothetical protein